MSKLVKLVEKFDYLPILIWLIVKEVTADRYFSRFGAFKSNEATTMRSDVDDGQVAQGKFD